MKKFIGRNMILAGAITALAGCSPANQATVDSNSSDGHPKRPNVLLIVADDLGYSDLGAFGGEIETPNLDALAMSGVRLTNFYTAPTCSPTRSMLLTGKDSHAVGLGAMKEALPIFPALQGKPGYEGYLDPSTTTIAEMFQAANYRTMMTGKWHLGLKPEQQPNEHGFDQSFVLLQGGGNHFGGGQNGSPDISSVDYTENGQPATFPVGEYSSDFYASQMIKYLTPEQGDDRPFFSYLAFTAPHWPLQAPQDLIAKYKGRYDAGPAAMRTARLERMQALGLLDEAAANATLVPLTDWDSLSVEKRSMDARKMEIYAAMVDSVDQNVGRVLEHLRLTGEMDNTIIIFMSDNGAEGIGEGPLIGRTSNTTNPKFKGQVMAALKATNSDIDRLGSAETFLTYGNQWAQAAMAPSRQYKSATEEGGIKAAAFVAGPGIKGQRIVNGALSVRDILPTAMDLAAISDHGYDTKKTTIEGDIALPTGISWKAILEGSADAVRAETDAMAWELFYKSALRLGDWKIVHSRDDKGFKPLPQQKWSWKLYNLKADPGESQDVQADNPEVFERLMTAWEAYAQDNGVVPISSN